MALSEFKSNNVSVSLNTRDNFDTNELYLTVIGSSIESGDEGLVGRGNRINGLISSGRPMSMEGACGKNPVYHVGKLYNLCTLNIALEQLNPIISDHLKHIDSWLTFISKMGLFMGEMTVRIVKDDPDWGGRTFDAITAKMYYGGLEIGVANWFVGIPQESRNSLRMSDVSFGLERLVWVTNKSNSYFDAIGPLNYSINSNQRLMDDYRTAVLMALSGVEPGNKDRPSKLRALVKDVSDPKLEIDRDLVVYYANWWKKFANYPVSVESALQVILDERNRNINLDIKNGLGIADSISIKTSPAEYIDRIIAFGIPFDQIKRFLIKYFRQKT